MNKDEKKIEICERKCQNEWKMKKQKARAKDGAKTSKRTQREKENIVKSKKHFIDFRSIEIQLCRLLIN